MQYMPRGRQRREHLSPAPRAARTCAPPYLEETTFLPLVTLSHLASVASRAEPNLVRSSSISWEVSKSSSMPETVGRASRSVVFLSMSARSWRLSSDEKSHSMKSLASSRSSALAARSVGLLGANAKDPHLTRSPTLIQPVAELQRPTIIYYLQLNSLTSFQSLY